MINPMKKNLLKFLKESNAIERVYDIRSLELALEAWKYLRPHETLTRQNIQETHRLLMREHLEGDDLGKFRTQPVFIGAGQGAEHSTIPTLISGWLDQANSDRKWPQIKKSHVDYEKIHPFIDGNGRTGRIFMNWCRMKCGLPLLVIEEEDKYSYYNWFN